MGLGGRYCGWLVDSIYHFRDEKGSVAEMRSIHGSGLVTGVAPVDLIPHPSFCGLLKSINHTCEMILGWYIIQG